MSLMFFSLLGLLSESGLRSKKVLMSNLVLSMKPNICMKHSRIPQVEASALRSTSLVHTTNSLSNPAFPSVVDIALIF